MVEPFVVVSCVAGRAYPSDVVLRMTLECIKINKLIRKEATVIKIVQYFLENTPILKKLKLSFTDSPMSMSMTNQPVDRIFMMLTSRMLSRRCQVIIS